MHVFREPHTDGDQQQFILKTPAQIAPLTFPDQPVILRDSWPLGSESTQAEQSNSLA